MLRLREQGVSYRDIAEAFDCSISTVRYRVRRAMSPLLAGTPGTEYDWPVDQRCQSEDSERPGPAPRFSLERMQDLRRQGWTHQQIAADLGCSRPLVGRLLAEHGDWGARRIPPVDQGLVLQRRREGWTQLQIAEALYCSRGRISQILKRRGDPNPTAGDERRRASRRHNLRVARLANSKHAAKRGGRWVHHHYGADGYRPPPDDEQP